MSDDRYPWTVGMVLQDYDGFTYRVDRLTKTQVVAECGVRFMRATGAKVGGHLYATARPLTLEKVREGAERRAEETKRMLTSELAAAEERLARAQAARERARASLETHCATMAAQVEAEVEKAGKVLEGAT